MKRHFFLISILLLLVSASVIAEDPTDWDDVDDFDNYDDFESSDTSEELKYAKSPAPDNLPFGVGERLRYHMDFSFVRAGRSEMQILGIDTSYGKDAFHFRSRVKSTKGIDLIYKVRDVVESWFDVKNLYSLRYERNIREGNYRHCKFFDYDHNTGFVSVSNEFGPKGVYEFEPLSHNIISALYWVRNQELEKDVDLEIPIHDLNKQYNLKVRVYGIETIEVPLGEFRCWKVEPVVESAGLFKKKGRLWVWITDDDRRIPVMMKSEISVGTIDGKLVEYERGVPYEPGMVLPEIDFDSSWNW